MNLDNNQLNVAQAKIVKDYLIKNLLEEDCENYNANLLELQDICSQIKDYENINEDIDEVIRYFKKTNEYKYRNLEFGNDLIIILNKYTNKEWQEEPLDSDEVDILVTHLRNQLNLINGNITNEEYRNLEFLV